MQHEEAGSTVRAALRRSQSSEWHNDDIQPSMRKKYDGDLLGNNIESIIETLEVLKPKEDSSSTGASAMKPKIGSVNRSRFVRGETVRYVGADHSAWLRTGDKYFVEEVKYDSLNERWVIKVFDGFVYYVDYFDEKLFEEL